MTEQTERRGRGPGKKPSMRHVNLRMAAEVFDFYAQFGNASKAMRMALEDFMRTQLAFREAVRQTDTRQMELDLD